ncbi:MAG: hypothetical protein Q9162_007535 [Coniocarpon cinnabarinum]
MPTADVHEPLMWTSLKPEAQSLEEPTTLKTPRKSKAQRDGGRKIVQAPNKDEKGPKRKGTKGSAAPTQPYYKELIMQLTGTSNLKPTESAAFTYNDGSLRFLKERLQASSSVTTTTTTTTTTTVTTTHAIALGSPQVRAKPRRSISARSIKSIIFVKSSVGSLATTVNSGSCSSNDWSSSSSGSDTAHSVSSIAASRSIHTNACKAARKHSGGRILSLAEMQAESALHFLLSQYGGVQHGGILDPSYSFFVNACKTAAISFIIKDHVAVVSGDPLCPPEQYDDVLQEFARFRRRHRLAMAVFGGSDGMLAYGKMRGWSSIRFGHERVVNPLTNPVLHGKVQKQIVRQNKALLDPERGGNSVHIYTPITSGRDMPLEGALRSVYDAWKDAKNTSGKPQRYTTVYDPFALTEMMIYIYTRDRSGTPNGFAALRRLGSRGGYYIDPCVAAPGAPSRIPDLLYFTAMGLLNVLGIDYLALGMEPADSLDLHGFPTKFAQYAKRAHGSLYQSLQLGGKREYHAKFRPDDALGSGLHLMFPGGCPGPRRILSVVHFANISLRGVMRERWHKLRVA